MKNKTHFIYGGIIFLLIIGFVFFLNRNDVSPSEESFIQQSNISTNLSNSASIVENELINKSLDVLVLNSQDIEGGYSLIRQNSGYGVGENYLYAQKVYIKSKTDLEERRDLTIFLAQFRSLSDAESFFYKQESILREDKLFSLVKQNFSGEKSIIYKKDYSYNFYEWDTYNSVVLYKNMVIMINLDGYAGRSSIEEPELYINRQIALFGKNNIGIQEISLSNIFMAPDYSNINISIAPQPCRTALFLDDKFVLPVAYGYNLEYKEYEWGINDEGKVYTSLYNSKEKEFTILRLCINNSGYETISIYPENFILADSKGNYYRAFSKNEHSKDSLLLNERSCVDYIFITYRLRAIDELKYKLFFVNNDEVIIGIVPTFNANDIFNQNNKAK